MKVNSKILSIPPYISTSWKNVVSLHVEQTASSHILMIGLVNGSSIEIPELDSSTIESVFVAHEKHLEQESLQNSQGFNPTSLPPGIIEDSSLMNFPLRLGIDPNMGNLLQHNPEASDSPDLPKEVIEKIAGLSKVVGMENSEQLPKPEPHCNCMHCQIMRVLQDQEECDHEALEEEVSAEDLRFRDWEIKQSGDKLYIVTNPLNEKEQYNVYLGSPIGCTCGQSNCEHITSVLNS